MYCIVVVCSNLLKTCVSEKCTASLFEKISNPIFATKKFPIDVSSSKNGLWDLFGAVISQSKYNVHTRQYHIIIKILAYRRYESVQGLRLGSIRTEENISNPISLKHNPSSQNDQFLTNFDNILQINVFLCRYLKAGVGKCCLRETLY